ncbi:MAG: insulinase family protein [Clostridia bacterium]|nr:insulinase family protein [Clostridia bacterium]
MPNREEQTHPLAVGVPLYTLGTPHTHSFCLSLYLRGGSIHESAERSGVTHFIEHLIFRSINRRLDGKLYETLDRLGLAVEGVTYRELTQLSITGAPQHFDAAVGILSLALAPLSLSMDDFLTERSRIKAEIREEGEKTSLDYFTDRTLFGDDAPTSRPITGWASGLSRMSRAFVYAEKERLCSKENLFFYLTGAFPEDAPATLDAATRTYSLPSDARRESIVPVPDAFFHRDATVAVKGSDKTLVRLSFDVDTARYTDASLTLLYDVLFGDGEESFFHRAMSEGSGLLYSFRGVLDAYRNVGVIGVTYEIAPRLLEKSLSLALGAIARAKTEAAGALPFVRAPYTDNAAFLLDDGAALNFNRAYETKILSLPYATVASRAAAYASVTGEALCRMAKEIFRAENATLTLKGRALDTQKLRALLIQGLEDPTP